jgi:D-glycero-alpha-D-manno-heptose 1-phosphate guanylyltransferase
MGSRTVEALLLVGGLATRLRPALAGHPKAMAEVASRPFLEWLVFQLRRNGIRRAILCTGYLNAEIERHFKDGTLWGMEIVYSHEQQPLGTGGAIRLALEKIRGDSVLVLNGDSYCEYDLTEMEAVHFEKSAAATINLLRADDCSRFGTVQLNHDGSVSEFVEKRNSMDAGIMNSGVYIMQRDCIESIPGNRKLSLEQEVFPALIGHGLYGVVGKGPFIDIGTPESYRAATEFMSRLTGRKEFDHGK